MKIYEYLLLTSICKINNVLILATENGRQKQITPRVWKLRALTLPSKTDRGIS